MTDPPSQPPGTPDDRETQPTAGPARTPTPAPLIGGCTIVRIAGSGGMGVVYEALQHEPRRTVAIKVVRHRPGASEADVRARFKKGVEIQASLQHPAIVQVYEAGVYRPPDRPDEPEPFMIMEFVPGARTLDRFALERETDRRTLVGIIAEIAEAVHEGHARGIIHRDLKPENILVDASNRPKLIDFGVSKSLGSASAGETTATTAGSLVGTLQYMSPEQLAGEQASVGVASDVYALGVIAFEMIAKRRPFKDAPEAGIPGMLAHRRGPVPWLNPCEPPVDEDLERVIRKAMRPTMNDRYASAQLLAADLRHWLAGKAVLAGSESVAWSAWRSVRRAANRTPTLTAIALASLATALSTLAPIHPGDRLSGRELATRAAWAWRSAQQEPYRHVAILALDDDQTMAEIAAARGIRGVTAENAPSGRLVFARLLRTLARTRASAVAMDYYFDKPATPPEIDAEFAAAAQEFERATKTKPVVGVYDWPDSRSPAGVTPTLAAFVQWGGLSLNTSASVWSVDLALLKSDTRVMPSLALQAFAAARHPGRTSAFTLVEPEHAVVIAFNDAEPGLNPARGQEEEFSISAVGVVGQWKEKVQDDCNINRGDAIAKSLVVLPAPAARREAVRSIGWALDPANAAALDAFVREKIVFVANTRSELDDRSPYLNQGPTDHIFAHASAAEHLFDGTNPRVADTRETLGLQAGLGLGGAWIARRKHRVRWIMAAAPSAVGMMLAACVWLGVLIDFTPAVLTLALAFAFGWLVWNPPNLIGRLDER